MDIAEKKFIQEELYLRDYLATDRTVLAIDRTLLAYVRTALTMFVAGVSFLKFFDTFFIHFLGWLLIVLTVVTLLIAAHRYFMAVNLIKKRKSKSNAYEPAVVSADLKK